MSSSRSIQHRRLRKKQVFFDGYAYLNDGGDNFGLLTTYTATQLQVNVLKEAGYIVPQVLLKPTAIFQGLTRDADEPHRGAGWLHGAGVELAPGTDAGWRFTPFDALVDELVLLREAGMNAVQVLAAATSRVSRTGIPAG